MKNAKLTLKKTMALFIALALLASVTAFLPAALGANAWPQVYKDFSTTPGRFIKIAYGTYSGSYDIYIGAPGKETFYESCRRSLPGQQFNFARGYYIPNGQTTTRVLFICYDNTPADKMLISPSVAVSNNVDTHNFTSGAALDVTQTTATISGAKVGNYADNTYTNKRVLYSSDPAAFRVVKNYVSFNVPATGSSIDFGATLTGLTPGTTYYYMTSVINGRGDYAYSDVRTFRTLSPNDPVNLIKNGSFEQNAPTTRGVYTNVTVPGWSTEGNSLEIHRLPFFVGGDTMVCYAADGLTSAELNTDLKKPADLYQDFATTPGAVLDVSFAFMSRIYNGSSFAVQMGAPGSEKQIKSYSGTSQAWEYQSFQYTVPAGQYTTRLKFVSLNGNSYSCSNDIDDVKVTSTKVVPVVATGTAQNITSGSANIVASSFDNFNLSKIGQVGVKYGTNPSMSGGTYKYTINTIGSPFSSQINGLLPGTTYYYVAYVNALPGSGYADQTLGEIKSFTTTSNVPAVTTGSVQSVTSDTASIAASTFENFDISKISQVGVKYGTNPSMTLGTYKYTIDTINTPFDSQITGLTPETTYYYVAYVNTPAGSGFPGQTLGEIKTFTTAKEIAKTKLEGKVVWNDSNNLRGLRPADFTINLLRDGVVVDSKTISSTGDGMFSFTGIPVTTPDGTPYVYTVAGANLVDGYTTTINGTTITITNTLKRYYVTTRYVNATTGEELFYDSNMVFYGDNFTAHPKAITGRTLLPNQTSITYTFITEDKYPTFYYN